MFISIAVVIVNSLSVTVSIKSGAHHCYSRLLLKNMIFQSSLNQGVLPHIWKSGAIVPVHKKGSRTECGNYRPISLTCICSKILEHIIVSNISDHLDAYHVLCEEQHGLRHHRCCESQLISTIDDIASSLNEWGQCDVLFLDFSKAFHRVPHSHLIYKLNHYGICGPLLKWLESFLTNNRSQHVILNNCTSHETSVLSGIPQGTILAPLLFLLYVNDLPQCVCNKIKLYPDDVLLYSVIHSEADCVRLQEDLKLLHQWSILWQMESNPSKCEFLRMTNKRNPITYQYSISDAVITHAKYLRVIIDEKLSWNEHILKVTNKAR